MTDSNATIVKRYLGWIVLGFMLAIIGVLVFFSARHTQPSAPTTQIDVSEDSNLENAPSTVPDAIVDAPVTIEPEPTEPLPTLEESDATLLPLLENNLPPTILERHLVREDIITKFVITVDNLDRSKVALDKRVFKAIPGEPFVLEKGDRIMLSEDNFLRYDNVVRALDTTNLEQLVALYVRHYPLFQQAYEQLGYPDEQFHSRLVQVLDHLLLPIALSQEPVELLRPKSLYEFRDPSLESLSAGQKMLIRMGEQNATISRKKLAELRRLIAAN
ncbi:MAG: DUF3014 domain-containing protein [Pseudomonadota bacterium]